MADVKAQLNNLRIAPRKVRAVVRLLKGKDVNAALHQLDHFVKKPVLPVKKLIMSSIANAENNFNMVRDNLFIKEFRVDEGTKLKRFKAKGFGRAALIQKKTSHIDLVLGEKKPGLREEKAKNKKHEAHDHEHEVEHKEKETKNYETKKPEIKKEMGSRSGVLGNLGKKIFKRKAV